MMMSVKGGGESATVPPQRRPPPPVHPSPAPPAAGQRTVGHPPPDTVQGQGALCRCVRVNLSPTLCRPVVTQSDSVSMVVVDSRPLVNLANGDSSFCHCCREEVR